MEVDGKYSLSCRIKIEYSAVNRKADAKKLNVLIEIYNNNCSTCAPFSIHVNINQSQMMKNTHKAELENLKYLIPCPLQQQMKNITLGQKPKESGIKIGKNRRSRSRRHRKQKSCIDAQFSQDQQQLQTTTSEQPKNESPKQQTSKTQTKMTFNNLAYFPQGSLLSVKTCKLDIPSKVHGNVVVNVEILSEQQHKKIVSSFFDPGFDILSIKKDKRQSQIISYLSNPTHTLYKHLVCWFEAIQPKENDLLAAIAEQANKKQRIFGWHNDHVKLHIMSLRQYNMIQGFTAPKRCASQAAAHAFRQERLLMIMQLPQRISEIKILYDPFASISRKKEHFSTVNIQDAKDSQGELDDVAQIHQIVHITECVSSQSRQVEKQWFQLVKVNYQGWQSVQNEQTYTMPQGVSELKVKSGQILKNNCLPERIQRIRWQLGIKHFQMITSDDDQEQEQEQLPQPYQKQEFPLVEEILGMFDQFQQYKSMNFTYQNIPKHHQNQLNRYYMNIYSSLNQHYYKDQRFQQQAQQNYYNPLLYTNNTSSNQYEHNQMHQNYYIPQGQGYHNGYYL